MTEISRADVLAAIGEADELIIAEALRTKCSPLELRHALFLADGGTPADIAFRDSLPARMQRLVDLLGVALAQAPLARRVPPSPGTERERNRHAA